MGSERDARELVKMLQRPIEQLIQKHLPS